MWGFVAVVATLLQAAAVPADPQPKFPSLTATEQGVAQAPTFEFSAAAATSDDPVVLSVHGRKLRNRDRENRTSLQRYWLSKNVPVEYEFIARALAECDLRRPKEVALCDAYSYRDPATDREHIYWIYVGNWP